MSSSYTQNTFKLSDYKGFIITGILILALIFGFIFIRSYLGNGEATRYVFEPKLQRSYNPAFGNKDARLKIMYFPDLECEACKAQNPFLKVIKPEYKDKVQFVYKNNPGSGSHPFAIPAAQAANAIALQSQDKFFKYVDGIYDSETKLNEKLIEKVAQDVGADMVQFKKDRYSNEIKNQVKDDLEDLINIDLPASKTNAKGDVKPKGQRSGTPTFVAFKDGQYYDWWVGVKNTESFKVFLDEALK